MKKRLTYKSYKAKRIAAAVQSGFKRTDKSGTAKQKLVLQEGLSKLWDTCIGAPCRLCGKILRPRNSAFSHNIALANNGKHILSNILILCKICNKSQRTLSLKEYTRLKDLIENEFGKEKWGLIRRWMAGSRY